MKVAEQRRRGHIICWKLCRESLFCLSCVLLPSWHEGNATMRERCERLIWGYENSKLRFSRHSVLSREHES